MSRDGEYIFRVYDGEPLNPDELLASHPDWKDPTTLPTTAREKPHLSTSKMAEDPLEKTGIVGTFCRTVGTIQNAIDLYLNDVYEEVGNDRYKYIPSSSVAGELVYEDRWAYSNHATDPAYHVEANAFDLIRIHKFWNDDEKKSFELMSEWASSLPDVSRALLEERQEEARKVFDNKDVNDNWQDELTRDKKGNLVNDLRNIGLILNNDKYMKNIVYNQLADSMEIIGPVPWQHPWKYWRDADDAQLRWYIDQNYGTFSARNMDIAIAKVVDDHKYS